MKLKLALAAVCLSLAATPAAAAVISAKDGALHLENKVVIAASPEKVYLALGQIGQWWDPAHSYSGKASNMTLEMKPGGCWCEAMPGGGVKHGEVWLALPNQSLRLLGGLGPMQAYGWMGAMTYDLKAVDGGTEVTQTYRVSGMDAANLQAAPLFDGVIGGALPRLKAYVETGKPG